ncbi:FAD-dependent oxidoreductase [Chitinophaga qingshengii]|uniref:FAD-dependent oxidoreductase n=1 Tax=Chitinophaga qingshengii TaxID=1569794 RepID=A0ABR7TU52_9BACT|nr:FAD-dependent oxidoreductase [Chitinophaga qingshengii]MBC9934010.1 FAD-dependent oxidoreductase [Chitinophaga qingshengii]
MIAIRRFFISQLLCLLTWQLSAQSLQTDLIIIGGGASGTTAGIQAARMGARVTILEETTWLGGMLTSAGVSAIDGNNALPSGLWGEFREQLIRHYGSAQALATGWVSNTLFEPSVGNNILQQLVKNEKQLQVLFNTTWTGIKKINGRWQVTFLRNNQPGSIEAPLVIDATELGDVMAATHTGYRTGMDSRLQTGEAVAPLKANNYIQVLTYVATLKDYGTGADKTIPRPAGYDPTPFRCCCANDDPYGGGGGKINCDHMMQYGKLPNHKYMINWPGCGNDYPLNVIEMSREARSQALQKAKLHTLRYLYYLQTELGYKHLGLADDEYPTADKLPMIPYYREARRLKGIATLSFNHVAKPFDQPEAYYRTGIAVGDYPIDHHQEKDPAVPKIDFSKAKVPSYNIPLGSLIPATTDGLIVAEKSISVTNIVNGATRLQPVVLQLGQAAGALAAISLQQKIQPRQVAVRQVQQALLEAGVYLMPYIDVPKAHPHFAAIQRIGATGILRGAGVPYTWANQTWFYPQRPISEYEFTQGLLSYYPGIAKLNPTGQDLTPAFLVKALQAAGATVNNEQLTTAWNQLQLGASPHDNQPLNRETAAVLTDHFLHPFDIPVSFTGAIQHKTTTP